MSEHNQEELPFAPTPEEAVGSAVEQARIVAANLDAPADSPKGKANVLTNLTHAHLDDEQFKSAIEQVTSEEDDKRRILREFVVLRFSRQYRHNRRKGMSGMVVGRHTLVSPLVKDYPAPEKPRYDD